MDTVNPWLRTGVRPKTLILGQVVHFPNSNLILTDNSRGVCVGLTVLNDTWCMFQKRSFMCVIDENRPRLH